MAAFASSSWHCDDDDVPLDLQAAFARSWDEGSYPNLLHYDQPPPVHLTDDERKSCDGRPMKSRDVLRDKEFSVLVSDEGPIDAEYK